MMRTLPVHRARRTAASAGQRGTSLVELLVAMSILAVVTGMILVVWFALQKNYAFSVRSSETRETARDGMSRMVREIRDSGGRGGTSAGTGIVKADGVSITLRTAFNDPGATSVLTDDTTGAVVNYLPPLGGFYLEGGTVYRWRDTNGDGTGPSGVDRKEPLVTSVVNGTAKPVFMYTCINTTGLPLVVDGLTYQAGEPYPTNAPSDLTSIISVQITLRVDLNPGKSPEYMDLISTAQPRNHRQT